MSEKPPENVEELFHHANERMSKRRPIEARRYLEQALKLDSGQARIWHLLADTYLIANNISLCISSLESALRDNRFSSSDRISLQIHLASNYIRTNDLGAASGSIDIGAVIKLKNPTLAARAGYLLAICEEHRAALAAFEAALDLEPDNPELLFNTAAAHRSMGNLDAAESLYNRVLQLAPDSYPAYWLRSSLKKQSASSNHIDELEELINTGDIPAEGKIHLYFSQAKELEDLRRYSKSFSALQKGAELKKRLTGYNVTPDLNAIQEIQKTYTQSAIAKIPDVKNTNGNGVIFILGMPRTGSTLIDRVLSTNESVDSAGEPETFAQIYYQTAMQLAHAREPDRPTQLTAIRQSINLDFDSIGKAYQKKLSSRAKQKNCQYIIDKNPSNFLYLGAIKLALPNAKIIHIRRNPMDTCYAIFKTLFKNGHPYSYDLNDLAHYYCAYSKLMEHWKSIFGNEYFEFNYEDLITKPEETSRSLVDYCGLEWSEKYLNFHRNTKKGTATASAPQVRQPIYRSSLEMWKNYEQHLLSIKKTLSSEGII